MCAVNTALVLLFLAAVAGGAPRFLGLLVPYAIMVSFITWKLISDRYSLLLEPQSGRITLLTLSPRPWRGWQVIGEEPVERIVDIQIAQTQLRRPMYYLVLAFEGGAEVRFSAPLAHKAALRERAKLARWLDNARSVAAKEAHRRPIAPYLLGSP